MIEEILGSLGTDDKVYLTVIIIFGVLLLHKLERIKSILKRGIQLQIRGK